MILNEQTQAMLNEEIENLPDYVQDSMARLDWMDRIVQVAAKHRLNAKQTERLVIEIALVMVGLADPGLMYNEITQNIGVSDQIARKIIEDITSHVFTPLQEILEDITRDRVPILEQKLADLEAAEAREKALEEGGVDITESLASTSVLPVADGVLDLDAVTAETPAGPAQQNLQTASSGKSVDGMKAPVKTVQSAPIAAAVGYTPTNDPYHEPVEDTDVDPFLKPKTKNWYQRKGK